MTTQSNRDKRRFGAQLRELRRRHGYTRRQFAIRMIIDTTTLRSWELGISAPRPKYRSRLCAYAKEVGLWLDIPMITFDKEEKDDAGQS